MTASPSLPYHCPVLRTDFLQRPCEKNLKRAEFLKKNCYLTGSLEQCQECRGARLEVKDLEASKELKAFCPVHPEQRLEVVKNQRKGAMVAIMTRCALCEAGAKAPAALAVRYCKHHPDTPDHKNTGLCINCLRERAAANSHNRKGRKTSTGETPVPPGKPMQAEKDEGGGRGGPPHLERPPDEAAGPACKKHPEKAAVIDRLDRNMGLCMECLQERGRVAGTKVAQTGSSGPPIAIPLRQPKYAELKAWLEEQAEEYERTLTEEIMYRLKLACRMAGTESRPTGNKLR